MAFCRDSFSEKRFACGIRSRKTCAQEVVCKASLPGMMDAGTFIATSSDGNRGNRRETRHETRLL